MKTQDRAGDYFTVAALGRTQESTPEGFLLCRDVPIARIGEMLYAPGEIPVEPGPDGIIRATRGPEELFRPETVASINGKSIVDDHPEDDVCPLTWKDVTVGIVLNPRRGTGLLEDYLVADLQITDNDAIAAVRAGKRELSCGYNNDYTQTAPGRAFQSNIIFNHLALVRHGRCGSSCAIGDSAMSNKPTLVERLRAAFSSRDEAALNAALGDIAGGPPDAPASTHVHVHVAGATRDAEGDKEGNKDGEKERTDDEAPAWFTAYAKSNDERMSAMDAAIKALAGTRDAAAEGDKDGKDEKEGKEGKEGDDKASTADSADLAEAFADMLSRGEIIAPGIKLGTFDAAAGRAQTLDRMCAFRRRALVAAQAGDNGDVIDTLIGADTDIAKMTCDGVTTTFIAASEMIKRSNDSASIGFVHDEARGTPKPASIADINERNARFWASKS